MRFKYLAASPLALALAASLTAPASAQSVANLPPAPVGKLSDAVTPSAYRLDLTVDPAKPRFSGKAEIDAQLKAPSETIFLHGRDMNMTRAEARVGGKVYPAKWQQMAEDGTAILIFGEKLPAGPLTLAFEYDAPFGSGPAGMFRVKVADEWYSWTQHQSIDARASFPGFDEPGFKTAFTVTLRTPKGLTAVSNAPARRAAAAADRLAQAEWPPPELRARELQADCPPAGRLFRPALPLSQARPDHLADHARRDGECRGRSLWR